MSAWRPLPGELIPQRSNFGRKRRLGTRWAKVSGPRWRGRAHLAGHVVQVVVCDHEHKSLAAADRCGEAMARRLNEQGAGHGGTAD